MPASTPAGARCCRGSRRCWRVAGGTPEKDPKTRLQEWLQARQNALPAYELVSETGDDHAKHFRVRCPLGDPAPAPKAKAVRRLAEQQAAAAILEQLDK
jgi:ribonuclease-3